MWIENLILINNIVNINFNKQYWYGKIVEDHKNYNYKLARGNNFCLDNKFDELTKNLYIIFLEICKKEYSKLYGDFRLLENNSTKCWAYVTNKNDHRNGIHDHLQTSIINSVFYLSAPCQKSGGITFYRNKHEKYLTYYPRENDLIIFPNFLLHEPEKPDTEEYRISINMEIICERV